MATMDPMNRRRDGCVPNGARSLMRYRTQNQSPLSSPPMTPTSLAASPIDDSPNTFEQSVDNLLTLPRHTNEPLVSFLLRCVFKYPRVFRAIQASVTSLCRDHELDEFTTAYGDDDAERLVYVAFLYAMGEDIRKKRPIDAPDRLPHDITFREAIGMLHLAELFDLDNLRRAARTALETIFASPIPHSEYAWAFGKGSRVTGALNYKTDLPVKIELVDRFTHLWGNDGDDDEQVTDARALLRLGQENIEFYLLVKSFCLGNVNEDGVNDLSPAFLSMWMNKVRKFNIGLLDG